MKKLLCLTLALVMLFSLASCERVETPDDIPSTDVSVSETDAQDTDVPDTDASGTEKTGDDANEVGETEENTRLISADKCVTKLVSEEECTPVGTNEIKYIQSTSVGAGITKIHPAEAFSEDRYCYLTVDNNLDLTAQSGVFRMNIVDLTSGEKVGQFTDGSRYALSDVVVNQGKLYRAPAGTDENGADVLRILEYDISADKLTTVAEIPSGHIRVDIAALDGDNTVFMLSRRDGDSVKPTVYDYNTAKNELTVVCERSYPTDAPEEEKEYIRAMDTHGGQICIVTGKHVNGRKVDSFEFYSADGKQIDSVRFDELGIYPNKDGLTVCGLGYFGDYILFELGYTGDAATSGETEKIYYLYERAGEKYERIDFTDRHIGGAVCPTLIDGRYLALWSEKDPERMTVVDTLGHEIRFVRFELGEGKTVRSVFVDESGKIVYVTTDGAGNEELLMTDDPLGRIFAIGRNETHTVTVYSIDELKQMTDDGCFGYDDDFYDYLYRFFVDGWDFPEVNDVVFSDLSFTFELPFDNQKGVDFTFTVVESGLEGLKPGVYHKNIMEGKYDMWAQDIDVPYSTKYNDIAEVKKLRTFFTMSGIWNTPTYAEGTTYPGAYDYIRSAYGERGNWNRLDRESVFRYAKEEFGITEPEKMYIIGNILDDDKIALKYERYPFPEYDITDAEKTEDGCEITVQMYADPEHYITSHKILYHFDKDGHWMGYSVLEKGKYEPRGFRYIEDDGTLRVNWFTNLTYYKDIGVFSSEQYDYYRRLLDNNETRIYYYLIKFRPMTDGETFESTIDFTVSRSNLQSLPDGEYHRRLVGGEVVED